MAIPEGFDFSFLPEGEIIVDESNHDIQTYTKYDLKIQFAYNRIKSITNDWFIDNIGANLEEYIGKPCTTSIIERGKRRIIESLTFDMLWDIEDIYIRTTVMDNTHISYAVYLKTYKTYNTNDILDGSINIDEDPYSYEIIADLDLVKGVYIRYGWRPRRTGSFAGINYKEGPRPIIPYRKQVTNT